MKAKRLIAALCALCLLCTGLHAGAMAPAEAEQLKIGAGGAVIMDADTTRVLSAYNAHVRLPMASTTKIMTALVALENSSLDDIVTVPKEAYGTEGSSMYLNLGEKIRMEDLLYGLMLSSGNDAAVTIAIHLGGSVEGFARMMNDKAAQLGCTNTHFITPNGLHDPEHYTTAYDLALIASAAMQDPDFRTIVGSKYWKTTSGDVVRTLKNKNKILWQYEGGNGIKTGFTKNSGRCLAFSAERDGHTVVGIVLNCPDMWNASTSLLDYAFKNFAWKKFVNAGDTICIADIQKGMRDGLEMIAKEDILIPLREGEKDDAVELRVDCPWTLPAPVMAGQVVGSVQAWSDGRLLASTPLIAAETVLRKEYPYYLWRMATEWTA